MAMRSCLRILHLPLNTPYARKLRRNGRMQIINGRPLPSGEFVPGEVTFQWLSEHVDVPELWASFDILHIHFGFEFESIATVESVLNAVRERKKPIVYTCHDTFSVHGTDAGQYAGYLQLLAASSTAVITLTESARDYLCRHYSESFHKTVVIPHGYVVNPESPLFGYSRRRDRRRPRIAIAGAIRDNRQVVATLTNLYYVTAPYKSTLLLATRPIPEDRLRRMPEILPFLAFARDDPRISVVMKTYFDDDEFAGLLRECDALILPYTAASHSGQLALALDLGVTPIVPSVGHLVCQYEECVRSFGKAARPPVVVVDITPEAAWRLQSRMAEAVDDLCRNVRQFRGQASRSAVAWRRFREREHQHILRSHEDLYGRCLAAFNSTVSEATNGKR